MYPKLVTLLVSQSCNPYIILFGFVLLNVVLLNVEFRLVTVVGRGGTLDNFRLVEFANAPASPVSPKLPKLETDVKYVRLYCHPLLLSPKFFNLPVIDTG